ncbi:RinB [Staphylococcus phage StB20]|uniref:regulator n=1 Tax=Staphylococcus phage StB20 TaxID=1147043 RepID=UPI0002534CE0|nr:regulator [Staphylococcus phage StB20]AFD22316.1 RinB [Staphylococcus phage StB20]MBM6017183.1 regulator [Staphylococcus epidermidis]
MIKRILKIWFTIAMYELGKCIGRELYYKLTANDEVEVPKDFYHKNDQIDIENYIRKDDKF